MMSLGKKARNPKFEIRRGRSEIRNPKSGFRTPRFEAGGFRLAAAAGIGLALALPVQAAMVGHWTFDDGTGATASDSIHGNDATWAGPAGNNTWVAGLIGGATRHDDEDDGGADQEECFVTGPVSQLTGATHLTLSIWFNQNVAENNNANYNGLFMSRNVDPAVGQSWGIALENNNAPRHLDVRIANQAVDGTDVISGSSGWHHAAMTWDGTTGETKAYLDGNADITTGSTLASTILSAADFRFGDDPCCNKREFTGTLDDAAMWDEVLSGADILTLYTEGLAGNDAYTALYGGGITNPPPPPGDYYVAPGGSDLNSGASNAPFATIQKAANMAQPGDLVYLREGTYRETVTMPRSGLLGAPITFSSYGDEEVVISGCDPVTGWVETSTNDVWAAANTWNMGGDGAGNTLFVDGVLEFEARQGAENDPMNLDLWGEIPHYALSSTGFTAPDLAGWGDDFWNGAKVRHHTHDWVLRESVIADYDSSSGQVTFQDSVGTVSQKHRLGYTIYGTIRALNEAGEWFKDVAGGQLFYHAQSGQDPAALEIEFKRRDYAFDLRGRNHIRLHGITFRGVSLRTDGNTDYNTYDGNTFYAYDKANYGRFWITGDRNVFRDNEVKQVWGSMASIGGTGNELVNNYLHDIGYNGTSRVMTMSGYEHLVSHNTVRKFARSFLDGYPYRSEFKYNLFEDGANLSWDTGVFDGDSGRGNGGGCVLHHNVFRNSDPIGIYMASYAGLDLVLHHNLVYDFEPNTMRSGQLQFNKFYHNTWIGAAPYGDVNAQDYAVEVRYNNNLQVTLDDVSSIGIDCRGNHNYETSDFVDFNARDLRLAADSGAIDVGVVLPGVNDGFAGAAPDAGALEYGEDMFKVGYDFADPPMPEFTWQVLPGMNLFGNGQFKDGLSDEWTLTGAERISGNAWNTGGTGLSRMGGYCIKMTPREGMRRTFTGLKPDTWYAVASETRLLDERIQVEQFSSSSGSFTTGNHRGENYVQGLEEGEWLRYDAINYGTGSKYDMMELTYTRPPGSPYGGDPASLEVRVGGPTGPVLGEFQYNPAVVDTWYASRITIPPTTGSQSVYLLPKGTGADIMRLATVRLLQSDISPDHKLTLGVRDHGGAQLSSRVGDAFWRNQYETFYFKTGSTATNAELFVQNNGQYDAYLDRLALYEKERPGEDAAATGIPIQSTTYRDEIAARALDGSSGSNAITEEEAEGWWQVDLGATRALFGITLTAPDTASAQLLKYLRVSVWDTDPRHGGRPAWEREYLDGPSLLSGETLFIKDCEDSLDGVTSLGSVRGRYVRIERTFTGQLGMAEVEVLTHDAKDLVASDGLERRENDLWEVGFAQIVNVGEIVLRNVDDPLYGELSNFTVSVWDRDANDGGQVVWEKSYFSSGSVARGGTFVVRGDEIGADGETRLASVLARAVRVQINGVNNEGTTRLQLAGVAIHNTAEVRPANNVAIEGEASQSSNLYTAGGEASLANNSVALPKGEFTSTQREAGAWWQVDLGQTPVIDQIVVYNRQDASDRLRNFRVSVWDADPEGGATELWSNGYSSIPAGGSLTISGDETDGGLRLDQVVGGRVVRVQLDGTEILSLPEVQVWTLDTAVRIDPAATSLNFDVGTIDSPVQGGWTRISPDTHGDVGWGSTVDAFDRGAGPGDLHRDFARGGEPSALSIKLQNGRWQAALSMGDQDVARDDMMAWAEGVLVAADIDAAAGTFTSVDFETLVTDGELRLQFDDNGGSDPHWVLNRVALTRLGDVPATVTATVDPDRTSYLYDFGTPDSPVEPGWERIAPNTVGDIAWSAAVSAADRGAVTNDLYRDLVMDDAATVLEHAVSNGSWRMVLDLGDMSYARDFMAVEAEGKLLQGMISTDAGSFASVTGTVTVKDGSLSLAFSDAGGDPDWVVNRLSLERVNLDYDGDGLPNDWETLYFGGPTSADAGGNPDLDNPTNLEEYIGGTVPTNGASFFRSSILPTASLGTGVSVGWDPVVEGRVYTVERTEDLTLEFVVLEDDIAYPAGSYDDTNGVAAAFYRAGVRLAD